MYSEKTITGHPDAWSSHISQLLGPVALEVAGYATTIEITEPQLKQVYFPLLAVLAGFTRPGSEPERPPPGFADHSGARTLAGLAGIPGSGKSTFAAVLAHAARHLLPPDVLAVVGMDGWHFPNAVLDQRTTRDAAGRVAPLRQRKGGPESFDVLAMAAALRKLATAEAPVSLPVYDRRVHDPVEDALTVSPATRIVLVEGNYLLGNGPPWNGVSALLRPKLLLECDPDLARERIIARHVRGGLTPELAAAKYEANDRLNTEAVLGATSRADLCIRLEPEPALRSGA